MFPYCTVGGSARPDRAHLERSGDRKIPTGQSDQGADSCRDADHGGTLLSNRVGSALRSTARPVSKLLCIPYELFRKLGDKHGLVSALVGACNASYCDDTVFMPSESWTEDHHMAMEALEPETISTHQHLRRRLSSRDPRRLTKTRAGLLKSP
jgi:hypothetical protein